MLSRDSPKSYEFISIFHKDLNILCDIFKAIFFLRRDFKRFGSKRFKWIFKKIHTPRDCCERFFNGQSGGGDHSPAVSFVSPSLDNRRTDAIGFNDDSKRRRFSTPAVCSLKQLPMRSFIYQ